MSRLPSADAVSGKAVPAVASLAFLIVLTALSGCGQKGPLYMPRAGTTSPAALPAEPVAPTAPEPSAQPTPATEPGQADTRADRKQGDQHAA